MIVITDRFFPTKEHLEEIIDDMYENAYKDEHRDIAKIYHDFLMEVYDADVRLQNMVNERISDEYTSYVGIPFEETVVLSRFYFSLRDKDFNEPKRRDELIYEDLCKICFGHIKPYFNRLLDYYKEP